MIQIWKVIKDYPMYSVSNLGSIKNNKTGRILKQLNDNRGYLQVRLYNNGKAKTYKVHKIVFETFKGKITNKMVINHKDGNKYNNSLKNLECVTQQYNVLHAINKGNFYLRPVYCHETGKEYTSLAEVSRELNVDAGNVQKVCAGKCKHTKGYHFRYI